METEALKGGMCINVHIPIYIIWVKKKEFLKDSIQAVRLIPLLQVECMFFGLVVGGTICSFIK